MLFIWLGRLLCLCCSAWCRENPLLSIIMVFRLFARMGSFSLRSVPQAALDTSWRGAIFPVCGATRGMDGSNRYSSGGLLSCVAFSANVRQQTSCPRSGLVDYSTSPGQNFCRMDYFRAACPRESARPAAHHSSFVKGG